METLNNSGGKPALRFWMDCKGQSAAVAELRQAFAMRQTARIRRCQRRGELFSVFKG